MSDLYPSDKAVLLFDGVCRTCNRLINAIMRSDSRDQFRFEPQQSDRGQKILNELGTTYHGEIDSLVLCYRGKVLRYSSAGFEICRILGGLWKGWLIFSFLPRSWTDAVYRAYSARRHLFGRRKTCRIPTEAEKRKFLS